MDELAASEPGGPDDLLVAYLLGLEGEKEGSEELLVKAISKFPAPARRATNYHHFTYEIACVYAINGNGPGAMKWLRESAEKGLRSYTLFARDPFLHKIRRLPEFRRFMGEMRAEYEQLRNEFKY
jgi:hypothetical protein